jgi:hypothetical protein
MIDAEHLQDEKPVEYKATCKKTFLKALDLANYETRDTVVKIGRFSVFLRALPPTNDPWHEACKKIRNQTLKKVCLAVKKSRISLWREHKA